MPGSVVAPALALQYRKEMMHKKLTQLVTVSVMAAALMAAAPASAQRMSLSERVTLLEQQAGDNQSTIDLLRQVNLLKDEVQALRSQVEQLDHQLAQLKQTTRAQYLDLDGRINRMQGGADAAASPAATSLPVEPAASAAPPAATGSDAPASSSEVAPSLAGVSSKAPTVYGDPGTIALAAGERAAYDAAFDALKAGDYVASARLFQSFLSAYPNGAWSPNALYWLGESYYVTQNYAQAQAQFQRLIDRYPTHGKVPASLLKVGLSQLARNQLDAAQRTLTEVTSRYPGSVAADTAADRLNAIGLEQLL